MAACHQLARGVSLLVFVGLATLLTVSSGSARKCLNGTVIMGRCECHFGFTGVYCQRQMHCDGYERHDNGSCVYCLPNWGGSECDNIDCGLNGNASRDATECICSSPYSGRYCTNLTREDIYSHYNNRNATFLPISPIIGALFIIPLCLIVHCCNKISQKHRSKKVESHLEKYVGRDLKSDVVHSLLYDKIDKKPKKSSKK